MHVLRCLATATLTLLPIAYPEAAASRNWVDRYISGHGHCASFPMMLSTRPLDKPIEDWTDGDLVDLKAALDRCDALPDSENGGGSQGWTRPVYQSIEQNVRERQRIAAREADAKASAQVTAEQAEAARQRRVVADKQASAARLAALQHAAEVEAVERRDAKARTAAIADELKAAAKLADETEARAKAARVEAQARYGVEAARKRAADAEKQASNADAQARANREAADRQFAEAYPVSGASSLSKHSDTPRPNASSAEQEEQQANKSGSERQDQSYAMPVTTNTNFVACKLLNELATASQGILHGQGDIGAALVNAGECFLIDQGTKVHVRTSDIKGEDPIAVCVAISGHRGCLWVPTKILEDVK